MRLIRDIGLAALVALAIALPAPAQAASPPSVAALQTALKGLDLYRGKVDGIKGPRTRHGVIVFQRRKDLPVDGIAGPRTRKAMGWRGRPALGSRVMRLGQRGWDVAALQFLLQRGGYGVGRADGIFGRLTRQAVRRAQSAAGVTADGLAGPKTIALLKGRYGDDREPAGTGQPAGPISFMRPVPGPIGDGFGVRAGRDHVHQGVDFPVPRGTLIGAAGRGTTIFAGHNSGGYGNLVVIQHRLGYTTWYAHMRSITTWVGERVAAGTRIGYVGSTGNSTGPHLHFEIRHFDTPINPLPLLPPTAGQSAAPRAAPAAADRPADGTDHGAHADRCETAPAGRRGADWIASEPLCAG